MFFNIEKESINIYYASTANIKMAEELGLVNTQFHTKEGKLLSYENIPFIRQFLNWDEIRYLYKVKSRKRKSEFLYSRLILKSILSYYMHVDPKDILICKGEHGKLYLKDCEALKFNISHSDNFIVCAVMLEHEIGIDVEDTKREIRDVAETFFCRDEIAYLQCIEHEFRNDTACKLWTMKEAYVKALGKGLTIPFDSFNVLLKDCAFFYSIKLDERSYLSVSVPERNCHFTIRKKELIIKDRKDIEFLLRGRFL